MVTSQPPDVMKLFMSDDIVSSTSCPRCHAPLKTEHQSYLIAIRANGEIESVMISCEGGSFCPGCPIVVLDSQVFEEIISRNVQSRDVQSRDVEYAVLGMVDLEAVPEEKWDIPFGDDDNPIPLIKFERASTEESQKRKIARVGRNAPCPCGSGKKYKKCCLRPN